MSARTLDGGGERAPVSELDALRAEVASAHSLDARTVPFLVGLSVEEVEASAREFAQLAATSGARVEVDYDDPLPHAFVNARAEKRRRQRELATALHGPRLPARDEHGRFARRGFDGGARTPVPIGQPPEQAHSALAGQLAGLSRLRSGQSL